MGTNLLAQPAGALLNDFGAGKPTPGSGSAAALNGILAAKLIRTVCLKTIQKNVAEGKKDSQINLVMEQAQEIVERLSENFQKDSDKFQEIVDLRTARDGETDRDKATKIAREANSKLEQINDVVFNIAEDCLKLVDLSQAAFENGWPHIRGDAGAAMSSAIAGATSCAFVIGLNAKTLRRRKSSPELVQRCESLTKEVESKQALALTCVTNLTGEAREAISEAML